MQAANPRSHAFLVKVFFNRVLALPGYSRGPGLLKSSEFIDLQNENFIIGGKTMNCLNFGPNVIYFILGDT